MKKQIHLTENELYSLIKESVTKILNEGKKVNNKPYFKDSCVYNRNCPKGKYIKPGEYIYDSEDCILKKRIEGQPNELQDVNTVANRRYGYNFIDLDNDEREDVLDYVKDWNDFSRYYNNAIKHNERAVKYDEKGKLIGDPLADVKGNKRERAQIADMLRINGITLDEYRKMTKKEQNECWDEYNDYYSPRAMRHREWEEMGDPDWDMIYDNLPYN